MRTLTVIAATLILGGAASAQPGLGDPATAVESDPLYYVELIVFSYNDGDRAEEDFRHGQDATLPAPKPQLFSLPAIELETLSDFRRNPFPGPGLPGFEDTRLPGSDGANEGVDADGEAIDTAGNGNEVDGEATDGESTAGAEPSAAGSGELGDVTEDFATAADGLAEDSLADDLVLIEREPAAGEPPPDDDAVLPDGFRILTGDELELTAERQRLSRLRPYHVLGHVGWAQTGVDSDRSVAIDLTRLGLTNPAGTIEVYLRRFLHVKFDLELFDGQGTLWTAPGGFGLAPFQYAQSYRRVHEENAIRSGELRYIDHPLFGVLIRITPAPEPEDETSAGAADRPAG
jgi:hypothetical protein